MRAPVSRSRPREGSTPGGVFVIDGHDQWRVNREVPESDSRR
jgi:hypothetical protein